MTKPAKIGPPSPKKSLGNADAPACRQGKEGPLQGETSEDKEEVSTSSFDHPRRLTRGSRAGAFQPLLVSYSYRDPATQELVHGGEHSLPVFLTRRQPPAAAPNVEQLRNVFITARAIAEAQRLALRAVDAELEELRWRHQRRRDGVIEWPTRSRTS